MKPDRDDVQQMVAALFTLVGSLERARRRIPGASALSVLQKIGEQEKVNPSQIATELDVHQSTITRHVQSLEEGGLVNVIANPDDRRSCTLTLTEKGRNELKRLTQVGLDRFAAFVADWDAVEVRTFTRLLVKLEESKVAADRKEASPGRSWQSKEA
ncbi:MAG TPA: MarR family transcriptional regulator [Rhodothermales bacterium]|nr:MarR family transcriptional regulator [Rhodothermales bacterium]